MSIGSIPYTTRLFTTDLDGTLLVGDKDNLKRSCEDRVFDSKVIQKTADALYDNNFNSVLINTGRNFSELREVEDVLKNSNLPIEAIALEDGKRLLKKPATLSGDQWLGLLFNKNNNYTIYEDKNWSEKNSFPLKTVANYLIEEEGFIHRKDNNEEMIFSKPLDAKDESKGRWEVALVPPGITFKVSVNADSFKEKDLKKYSKELTSKIQALLEEEGFDIKNPDTKECLSYVTTFDRNDVNKGSVADYYKQERGDVVFELRAGDGTNDIDLLNTSNPDVCPVQVGNNSKLSAALLSVRNLVKVATGELYKGIEQGAGQKADSNTELAIG